MCFALFFCLYRNALCGKLQCENVQDMPVFGIVPAIIQTPSGGTKCWGVDFQLGSDVPDPGMVNEGTKCDAGKVIKMFYIYKVKFKNFIIQSKWSFFPDYKRSLFIIEILENIKPPRTK